MYNTTNASLLGFISIAAGKKGSHLLFHPISGFLPKTKFQKIYIMPLALPLIRWAPLTEPLRPCNREETGTSK